MLTIYNSLTREIENFKPLRQELVKVYSCGPTPYNFAHIGNLRSYLSEDFIIRTLRFLGYRVSTTMNITDIDDKTIRDSQKSNVSLKEFTENYTRYFLEDLDLLGIERADTLVPISSFIDTMVEMINGLLKKGFAYVADDGSIYYSVEKFNKYGELANLDKKGMKVGVRINNDEYEKDQAADFALWKAYDESVDGPNKWEGKFTINGEERVIAGRPGWHIECSACNLKYFGPQIDLHMGGIDNLFPHHQNEIAQSEAFTGKTFSKYWAHMGHLLVEGKKMSKSANNFYTLRDVIAKYPNVPKERVARAFRLMVLGVNYRENFNFVFDRLEAALRTLDGFDALLLRLKRLNTLELKVAPEFREFLQVTMEDYIEYLEDDFNTPQALARIHDFISDLNSVLDEGDITSGELQGVIDLLKSVDAVFKVFDFSLLESEDIPEEYQEMLRLRIAAKAEKNYALADEYRAKLESAGYRVVDTKEGAVLEKIR